MLRFFLIFGECSARGAKHHKRFFSGCACATELNFVKINFYKIGVTIMQTIKFSKLIKKIQRAVEQKGFYIYAEDKCSTKKENRKFNINSIDDVVDLKRIVNELEYQFKLKVKDGKTIGFVIEK